jgi:hypothetical protein
MSLAIDLHVHTSRYSPCSAIDPKALIDQAVRAGLDGLVITEHHHQWNPDELDELVGQSPHPGFRLFSGFEYTSSQGDVLVYGLDAGAYEKFIPGWPPEKAVALVLELGGACIAAHPTRAGLGFDERLFTLPMAALEVCSVNLKDHERRLAQKLAESIGARQVACSDAHHLVDVGRYATEFEVSLNTPVDLRAALAHGRFRVADGIYRPRNG